jgi:predicted transposase/invertase (TIGR01784 family)
MTKLKHTFKSDILFKLLFTKYPHLLKHLVSQLLKIPIGSIAQFEIRNTEMPPERIGNKFCRLDIHMTVDGQQVSLEVQVENEGDYPERALFYWARLFSNALPAGGNYGNLPRTIIISILGFTLFSECNEFHSEFQSLEVTRNKPLTDKMALYFFELPKLPEEISKDDLLLLWLSLFKADTEEELKRINEIGVSELSEAVTAYHNVTTSSEFNELEWLRVKTSHDEAQALSNAERKGEAKGEKAKAVEFAQKLIKRNRPIDEIIEDTGLSRKEIINLKDAN